MSNPNHARSTAAAGEPPAVLTPAEIVGQLRTIREALQAQAPPTPELSRSQRRRLAHLDEQFLWSVVNTVGASPVLQEVVGRNDKDLRNEVSEIALWTAVADELRGTLADVVDALSVRRARLGLAVAVVNKVAGQLVRNADQHGQLNANVAEMKRLNPFMRKRKAAVPATQPAPAPTQPPAKS